ncbi:Uncharacterised protein [Niallia circulans]|jgi:hypothetical protein|nr:Uncharacterised protein [Niallia circulans]
MPTVNNENKKGRLITRQKVLLKEKSVISFGDYTFFLYFIVGWQDIIQNWIHINLTLTVKFLVDTKLSMTKSSVCPSYLN